MWVDLYKSGHRVFERGENLLQNDIQIVKKCSEKKLFVCKMYLQKILISRLFKKRTYTYNYITLKM